MKKSNHGQTEDISVAEQVGLVLEQPITQTLEKNYMPYAMSVIVSRAIPEIDGFKPSHRKLLYTMYKMGLLTGKRTKSANVVGQTMKLNPHGDMAIYETLVRLTAGNSALLHPYIDSKGNFGKHYSRDMAYAASRYTEVKLAGLCEEVFRSIDKETVDFVDNYDATMEEPILLPTTYPAILINPNQGIAVGMASQISSFNLREVCKATIEYVKNPDANLLKYMPAPDFESGGEIIYKKAAIKQIYETGRGSFKIRAKYETDKKNGRIEILEIPYNATLEKIIEEITELVKRGKIKEINDIRDESDKSGFKITVDCKKNSDLNALMEKLFRFTELEKAFSCNFNVLINGSPRVLGIKQILGEWLSWRRSCVRREVSYDLQKDSEKLHLLKGLGKILLDIDKAIRIIRETEKAADVISNLMKGFDIDEIQAEYIADIRLKNLNKQYILEKTADTKELENRIKRLRGILETQEKIDEIIINTLSDVAEKYGKDRKTGLVKEEKVNVVKEIELIDDYRLKLYFTEHGYLKKIPLTSLRSAGEIKTKDDDRIVSEIETSNKSDLILFSNKCNAYKMKIHEIKDHKPSELGEFLSNLLSLDSKENIIFIHATNDYKGHLLIAFENGKIARITVDSYETKTNRRKLINAFSDKSPVVGMHYIEKDCKFAAFSSIDKILVFDSENIPLKTTRSNNGVKVMIQKKGSKLTEIKKLEDSGIQEYEYYNVKRIPAVGYYAKENTLEDRQITF